MDNTPSVKNFPYKFKELDPAEKEKVEKLYASNPPDYVRVGPGGYVVFRKYQTDAANIYNLPLRSTDIFVASYQRSGTTWTQELVWLLASNLDYTAAADIPLVQRYPFLEQFMFLDENVADELLPQIEDDKKEAMKAIFKIMSNPITSTLKSAPSPRFIKTHLPMCLLPPKILDTAKVVYVARDPRDVAVSSYYHTKLFKLFKLSGEFKDFWNLFYKGLFTLTPYFEHVKEAWNKRNHPNMLFLFYEELSKDLPASVDRVAKFLGKELTNEQKERLCEHLKFDNFKNNKSVNFEDMREFGILAKNESFVRKGKAGGWRDHFDEEMSQQAEKWIAENLRDTDLRFPHIN